MPRYSLNHPHPRHVPTVERQHLGYGHGAWGNAQRVGTALRCSCMDGRLPLGKNNNLAPSAGGRAWANATYRRHLAESAPQVTLTRAQLEVLSMVHKAGHLPTTAHTGGDAVAGNVAAALVRKGLLRWRWRRWARGAPPAVPDGVEATAAGCTVLAQYDRWGWPARG